MINIGEIRGLAGYAKERFDAAVDKRGPLAKEGSSGALIGDGGLVINYGLVLSNGWANGEI